MRKKIVSICLLFVAVLSLATQPALAAGGKEAGNKKQYEVVFKAEGGEFASKDKKEATKELTKQVEEQKTLSEPPVPTKEGYTFAGWYSDQKLTKEWDFKTKVTAKQTLFAKWTVAAKDYQVSFDTTGGSPVKAQQVKEKKTLKKPAVPTKEGYVFVGWYSDKELTKAWDFQTGVTAKTELFAMWRAYATKSEVSFNSNGGSEITTQQIDENQTVEQPEDPTKTGFTFGGWYSDEGLTTKWDFATVITGNMTLYAQWNALAVTQYQVSFNSNGGSSVTAQQVDENQAAAKPADPTKAGFTFGGWYSDEAVKTAWDFASPITAQTTLYAKWNAVVATQYQVTFNSSGGSAVPAQKITENKVVIQPKAPTKPGFKFSGWYSDKKLTKAWDFSSPIIANTTLYAKWNAEASKQYQVSFNSNGGSAVASQKVKEKQAASKPKSPTKSGFTFGGWYSDKKLTKAWDFSSPITANTTLYAKWNAEASKQYQVSFNSNGGSAIGSQKVKEKQAASKPKNPTKSGFTFGGWYSDKKLTKAWDFSSPITANTTLYAKWNAEASKQYQVSFNSNGGSAVASQKVKEKQAASKPKSPTKSGFTFGGWYSDKKLTKAWDFKTAITGNTTLYAKWDAKKALAPTNPKKVIPTKQLTKRALLPQTGEARKGSSMLIGALILIVTFVVVVRKSYVNSDKR